MCGLMAGVFAKKRLAPEWFSGLHRGHKPDKWWLYFGVVSPARFTAVCARKDDGSYQPSGRR